MRDFTIARGAFCVLPQRFLYLAIAVYLKAIGTVNVILRGKPGGIGGKPPLTARKAVLLSAEFELRITRTPTALPLAVSTNRTTTVPRPLAERARLAIRARTRPLKLDMAAAPAYFD